MPETGVLDPTMFGEGASLLYVGSTLVGGTLGGIAFEVDGGLQQLPADGKMEAIAGQDVFVARNPRFTAELLDVTTAQWSTLIIPGATAATVGGVTTITPPASGTLLAQASLLANVRRLTKRRDNKWESILFTFAAVTQFSIRDSGNRGEHRRISVTIGARNDGTSYNTAASLAPFKVEIRDAAP